MDSIFNWYMKKEDEYGNDTFEKVNPTTLIEGLN